MRFRVRGIMKGTQSPVINKVDGADNPYDAATMAAKVLRSEGHDPSMIESLSIKPMKEAKAKATYFGKSTAGRKGPIGRKEQPATLADVGEAIKQNSATAPADAPAAAPTPAATEATTAPEPAAPTKRGRR